MAMLQIKSEDEQSTGVNQQSTGVNQQSTGVNQQSQVEIRWEEPENDKATLEKKKSKTKTKSQRVNIDTTHRSEKDTVSEHKINYEHLSAGQAAKTVFGGGIVSAVEVYALDLAAEQVFMQTVGAELAYAAGIASWAGPVGMGLGALVALGYTGYTYYTQSAEDANQMKKKNYNSKVELYNIQLKKKQDLDKKILTLKKCLMEQEAKMNSEFLVERSSKKSRVVLAIGPTGYGKSLFCNRMTGNESPIDDLEDEKASLLIKFPVAEFASTKSKTAQLSKRRMDVYIDKNGIKKKTPSILLSIVDSPGDFDSKGNEKHIKNNMAEYFRACGGINMFCIFFRFGDKMNGNYKKLMKQYTKFWGNDIWKHCVVVITNCDKDRKWKKIQEKLPKVKTEINENLKDISDGICTNVQFFEFGVDNFESSTKELLLLLNDENSKFCMKYNCKNIKSPIDEIWSTIRTKIGEYKTVLRKIRKLQTELNELKTEF